MKTIKHISSLRFLAQIVFLLLPTSLIVFFALWNSNQYFSVLQEQWKTLGIYFSVGMLLAFFIYQFRLRFIPSFCVLIFLLFSGYKILDNYAIGEFDSFFITIQYLSFAYLFCVGWVCGWGLQRIRFFPILLSSVLLLICIIIISKTGLLTVSKLLQYLTPVVLYSVYIVYTTEALRNKEKADRRFWYLFTGRLILFCALLGMLFGGIVYLLYPEIQDRVEEYGGQGKEGENQMLQTKKDGTVENKESMGLGSSNNRNKNPEPLFCAHIENYLPGTEIPNPLYLTSFHFTKYDSLTETFERDTNFVYNDEFVPDPSKLLLYSTYVDSSKMKYAFGAKNKRTVEVEIYKKRLSKTAFIAPSTAFFVQPITVEKAYQKEFSSAYRSKSYVSDLNSAYFIYNSEDPAIRHFQEQRFEVLRKAKGYEDIDQRFMQYYTQFPSDGKYAPIKLLADSIAMHKQSTIDKILGVRDYFLQRNALGEKVFAYSDNPGIPGLPSASKLTYFLFESKKGYCAYYAGATVFLLRSMHIPCRVVTGFLTVDRSDKNKGWYWFYEDQSHGWVQVYFPEYGWIDFDTTVGNDDAQQSPTPDGTPPLQPPKPLLAMSAKIISVDTLRKLAEIHMQHMLYKDVEYTQLDENISVDVQVATIWKDSLQVPIQSLHKGDDVMLVSFAEKLKSFKPEKTAKELLSKFPTPVPIDEVYFLDLKKEEKKKALEKPTIERPFTYYIRTAFGVLLLLFICIFTIPFWTFTYFKYRMKSSKDSKQKAYYAYKAATFLLHQLQVARLQTTPLQYAQQIVDRRFGTQYSAFMIVFLKAKYANQLLNEADKQVIHSFYAPFQKKVKFHFKPFTRFVKFLNLNTFIHYFLLPPPEQNSKL